MGMVSGRVLGVKYQGMKVRIKRVDKSLPLPEYHSKGAVGFDIYSRDEAIIAPGEFKMLHSNLIVETPENYMLAMVARSSTFKKKGLILPNSVGIFDPDFCGDEDEMIIQVYNLSKEEVTVEPGERIAQGIFVKVDKADWEEVDKMTAESRGGIGSTG
jgi:dUTP pyrophosphatase